MATRGKRTANKTTARKSIAKNGAAANKGAAAKKSAAAKKAAAAKSTPTAPKAKRGATKASKGRSATRTPARGAAASRGVATERAGAKTTKGRGPVMETRGPASAPRPLMPVAARATRTTRTKNESRLEEIDLTCAAWADIVAERMSADQTFADLVEQLGHFQARDLRGLFLWDALQAAESHVALINDVLAAHIRDRRADPLAILADLRARQLRVAAVYAVNAFLAVLNQMKPQKPKWLSMEDLDPRFAVLALAHQTLGYALEALRVDAPADVTEHILSATQDEAVWVWRRMPEPGTETLAACAAAAAFFRALGADRMTTTDEVAALYGEHAQQRASA